jgi:hypothetical protein
MKIIILLITCVFLSEISYSQNYKNFFNEELKINNCSNYLGNKYSDTVDYCWSFRQEASIINVLEIKYRTLYEVGLYIDGKKNGIWNVYDGKKREPIEMKYYIDDIEYSIDSMLICDRYKRISCDSTKEFCFVTRNFYFCKNKKTIINIENAIFIGLFFNNRYWGICNIYDPETHVLIGQRFEINTNFYKELHYFNSKLKAVKHFKLSSQNGYKSFTGDSVINKWTYDLVDLYLYNNRGKRIR